MSISTGVPTAVAIMTILNLFLLGSTVIGGEQIEFDPNDMTALPPPKEPKAVEDQQLLSVGNLEDDIGGPIFDFSWKHKFVVEEHSISPDDVSCNLPLLLFVTGPPNAGKTTFTRSLREMGRFKIVYIAVDSIFVRYVTDVLVPLGMFKAADTHKIDLQFNEMNKGGKMPHFLKHVSKEIKATMETEPIDILIVDFAMFREKHFNAIHKVLGPILDVMMLTIKRGSIRSDKVSIVDAGVRFPYVKQPSFVENEANYFMTSVKLSAHNFMTHVQHVYMEHLIGKHIYAGSSKCIEIESKKDKQRTKRIKKTAEKLGLRKNIWNLMANDLAALTPLLECAKKYHYEKFEHLNIPDLNDKRVLEIDSESGFFASQYATEIAKPKQVIAIDRHQTNVKNSQCFNSMIMGKGKRDVVTILQSDFTNLTSSGAGSFDVIFCVSTFNSYPDHVAFMKNAKSMLNDDGMLILVVTLTASEDKSYTEEVTNFILDKNETVVDFIPSIEKLKEIAFGLNLLFWGPTVQEDQKEYRDVSEDPKFARMVFHFSPQHNEKRIPFPTWSELIRAKGNQTTIDFYENPTLGELI